MKKLLRAVLLTLTVSACMVIMTSGVFADTILKVGSKGQAVTKLQTALKQKGFYSYKITGYYGSTTKKAVAKFQKANGIKSDGIAGPATVNKLNAKKTAAAKSKASRGTNEKKSIQSEDEDLYWLSRIISTEAQSEPYEGKIAIGDVILNRVKSKAHPDTIKDVIFEYYNGKPQFTPVADGTIYDDPDKESIEAAKDVLKGANVAKDSTYFFNPSKSGGAWIKKNKDFVIKIGNHAFYK